MLTHGGLFDGIGGFVIPAKKHGIKTLWESEIDKYCIKLEKEKFGIKQYGDITKIESVEPVDIITFGSPCNNLSLCGDKTGLQGKDSGLFFEAIRIINRMLEDTNGKYPKFIMWENVMGSLSSNKGDDFRTVLEEITQSNIPMPRFNKWSKSGMVRNNRCNLEWRVFNSQYWGVPQSRKRVLLVADFRKERRNSEEILFEQFRKEWNIEKDKRKQDECYNSDDGIIRTTGGGKQITSTIFASYGTKWNGNSGAYTGNHFVVEDEKMLRRITPLECERLFGFPDNWTYGYKDTIRYRMIGNSVVIPIIDYIYGRIIAILNNK